MVVSGEYDCQFVFVMKLTAVLYARSGVIGVAFAGTCGVEKCIEGRVHDDVEQVPVVEAGPLELAIVDAKAERLNQMQRAARCRAEARDVAGVRRYLRFDERDVQRRAADALDARQSFLRLRLHR